MKQSMLWQTVRGRLLLLAIGVELLMLTLLVLNSARLLHGAMTKQAAWHAKQIAPVLNAALTAPLAQRDFATLQAVLDESRATEELVYLAVSDRYGARVASSGRIDTVQPSVQAGSTVKMALHPLLPQYVVAVPISQSGQQLGVLHFGLDLSRIYEARSKLIMQGVGIAAVELVLSSIVLLLIGLWMTRHLSTLTKVSLEVAAGNLSPTVLPEGRDELGQLGAAFNTMSSAIFERVQELDRQKALLSATINSTTDIMFFKNLQGVYLGCNPAFMEFVGRSREDIVGSTDYDLMPNDQAEFFREQDRQMLAIGMPRSNEEWISYPDGRKVLVETKKSPLRDQQGQIIGLIGISRDMTERKKLEDELHQQAAQLELEMAERQKAQEALQLRAGGLESLNLTLESRVQDELRKNREKDAIMLQQDKLASIGQLAAGVAHEINNPMGFIMSNLSTLREYSAILIRYHRFLEQQQMTGAGSSAEQQAILKELDIAYILEDMQPLVDESLEGAERVKRIVQDLKNFARADENRFVKADLNQLVQSTINIVRNEIKYVADLELHLGEIPEIVCIPQQINQVITNLLVNAAQAMDKQGQITITTRQDGDRVLLKVRDTGCGMTDEVRRKIFDPFFTTKEVGKGTGLGLAICYDIIQKHQGEIEVESKSGVGTLFWVWLPTAGLSVTEESLQP
ncbi:PAS domain-containing protein [Trichlorobacter lovleyi]|uniref:ATP-binding protein n=1 Tax=Trichlorobacter lovleyi TaxID=313985 RepID=UPI00223FE5DB|nr:ATP-binding protein [Trichlorobacter lovleyi]QOX78585.1 PAS domain-containing protein [Trichlorobacter lovleyi]